MVCFFSLGVGFCCVRECSGWFGCCAFCLSCDAWSFRCVEIGRVVVSSCRCCVLVSSVQPVAVRRAAFCIVCRVLMLVVDAMGDQMVLAYSITGSVVVLYVVINVSFDLPQCVVVSVFSMFMFCLVRVFVFRMCWANVSFGSQVSPRIRGSLTVGSMVLFICSVSVVLYSAGSGVNSVVVVLSALRVSWFC